MRKKLLLSQRTREDHTVASVIAVVPVRDAFIMHEFIMASAGKKNIASSVFFISS